MNGTMPITFAKAPLVEIIAELRWPVTTQVQFSPAGIGIQSATQEQFFADFSNLAAQNGYPRSERLIPAGFPVEFGQAIWRFRPAEGATLWQVGAGVFTANGVPPYKSWDEFRPHLRKGLELLLQAKTGKDAVEAPFNTVSLRYIDAFGAELMQGLSMADFLCEKIGFELRMPPPLLKDKDVNVPLQLNTTFEFQLNNQMKLGMIIGPGVYQNEQVLMMTTGVFKNTPTAPDVDTLMGVFESAHTIIHDAFVEMTAPIHQEMQPKGVG